MSSGPTEILYFRCTIARCVSCIVTGSVWWRMSFVEVRRPGGSRVRGVALTRGKSAVRSASHLPLKVVCPLRGGIGLWYVLWYSIVFQMVLDDTAWSCGIRYAVLALRTIVDHLCCLCCLSFRLVSLGSWRARLSARLTALFGSVKFWFHHGASCVHGSFIGTAWLVASWMSWVMLVTAWRVSSVPWRFERSIRAGCMYEPKLPQSALHQQRWAFCGAAFVGRERVAARELWSEVVS